MDSLDMLANNMANASAPGYKADREFYSTYLAAEAADSPDGDLGSVMPVVERPWTDYGQGSITATGNPLDLALKGRGFFMADSPNGPVLTRDGNFRLSSKGDLVTQDGLAVLGSNGKPIQLNAARPIEITPDGQVRQGGVTVSRLDVVDAKDTATLTKRGQNYFGFSADAVTPASGAEVVQGSLESSNLQPAESAVRLVSVMRQFDMLQRAVTVGTDMNRRALEEVAKVTG